MNAEHRLSDEVRNALSAAVVIGKTLTLTSQLDRGAYQRVNKAIEMLGGKWNRSKRCHMFEDNAEDVVADAIATGLVLDAKKHFQFFETPAPVAERLVEVADLGPHHRVLEPSAGCGALVREIRKRAHDVVACELWDKNRAALQRLGVPLIGEDFLRLQGVAFDRIVANPPFTRGQDVAHVLHMYSLLAWGGRLASVMSTSWTFNAATRFVDFRAWVERVKGEWHELPPNSFAPSGTNVSAGILVVDMAVSR